MALVACKEQTLGNLFWRLLISMVETVAAARFSSSKSGARQFRQLDTLPKDSFLVG
jgi:hypothetical protein